MRRLFLLATVGMLAALAMSVTASAKGPSTASLSGPGLDRAIPVKGQGESGPGSPLVQFGGFFPQVFGQEPDPTTQKRPAGDLGPRYRVTYRVPGPSGTSTLVQDVYPYAKPSPVTHMATGQRFWGDMRTKGGWVVAPGVKAALVKAGLPKSPPPRPQASSGGGTFPWAWTAAGAIAAVLLLVLALRRLGIPRSRVLRSTA
jgi:hypothetical protein